MRINYLVGIFAFIMLTGVTQGAFGQISGPTTPCPGVNTDYVFNNGNIYTGTSWLITNGTIITSSSSGPNYYVTVQWTSTGSGSLSFKWKTVLATLNVTLTVPAVPTGGFTYSSNCQGHVSGETTTITRTGTPPSGVLWYWQTSSGGTSTALGSGASINALAGETYYLRAFGTCWSATSLATAQIPQPPNVINNGIGCINTQIVLSASAPGSLPIRWYNACSGGTLLATSPSYTTPQLSTTTVYYVTAYNSATGTESPRKSVVATVSAPAGPPTALDETNQSTTSFTANWSQVAGVVTYRLDIFTNASLTTYLPGYNDLSVSGTSQLVTGLTPGNHYYYRVQAFKTSTITCVSTESNVVDGVTIPSPPSNLATIVKSSSFVASWSAVNGAETYRVDVSTSPSFGAGQFVGPYQDFSVPTNTVEVTGLEHNTYYYRVKAANSSGVSLNSATIFAANMDRNYVRTTTPLIAFNKGAVDTLNSSTDPNQKSVTTTFFDGLGRPIQEVSWKTSPGQKDLVKPITYDQFGRTRVEYLPYVDGQDGWYKADFVGKEQGTYTGSSSPQYQFYHTSTLTDIARSEKPYAETIFEVSPLNRVLKKGAPGDNFQPDASSFDTPTDHTVRMDYQFNVAADNVLKWTYLAPASGKPFGLVDGSTTYGANQLLKTRTKDENKNLVTEFKDKEGRVILKEVQVTPDTYARTYYVYDIRGLLVCVIPPEATARLSSEYSAPTIDDEGKRKFLVKWAFQYKYDKFRRQVVKQIPGADSVLMVYDDRDRLVLTQDSVQRSQGQWSFTKYDALNRPVLTGLYASTSTRVVSQSNVNSFYTGQQVWHETFDPSGPIHGYTDNTFPRSLTPAPYLTATYYDGYNFVVPLINGGNASITTYNYTSDLPGQYNYNAPNAIKPFPRLVGQVTGSKVNILGSTNYLYSVAYFDHKGRQVQSITQNHKGGNDRLTSLFDFASRTLRTQMTHNNGTTTYVVKRRMEYDHGSRLKKMYHTFQSDADEVLLTENVYNEVGQLVLKKSNSRSGGPFAQQTDYRYHIRGWLEKINDPTAAAPNDLFSMSLYYEAPAGGEDAQHNGNISEMRWVSAGSDQQAYRYRYDKMSRLTDARFFNLNRPTQNGRYDEKILTQSGDPGYDLNGNIRYLKRYGLKSPATYGLMDDLTYTYAYGNRLTRVDDAIATGSNEEGFVEQVEKTIEYLYNGNGSMSKDENKGIANITYNVLNLPLQVNKDATDYLVYTYDALGTKLKQQVFGSTPKTTDYIGEFVYENNVLQYVLHGEGRIVPDNSPGAPRPWEYQYFLKDHLGNVRVTFSEKTTTTEIKATLENNTQTTEQTQFRNYGNRSSFSLFNHTPTGTYSQLLNGSSNGQVGLAKSYAVNPGDVFDLEVYVKYEAPTSSGTNLSGFFAALASAFSLNPAGGTGLEGQQAYNAFNAKFAAGPVNGTGPWDDSMAPRAYLNYILFDQSFALVDMGWQQVSTAAKQVGATPVVPHEYLSLHVKVQQAGYLYVYLSNETPQMTNVYFDDFQIRYTTAVEQASSYYPFGLSQRSNGFERTSAIKNPILFNGKEVQDELSLGWLDYGARMLMPEIGRWGVQDLLSEKYAGLSPYNYAINNPILYVDPDGNDAKVTGSGTKDQPYVVTANYYYAKANLNPAEVKALNAAVAAYNAAGGKEGLKVEVGNGQTSYVKFNLSVIEKDDMDQARSAAANAIFTDVNGQTQGYGNLVDVGPAEKAGDFGDGDGLNITYDRDKVNSAVKNDGVNFESLSKGVFVHEIAHNLGGEHSDGTSTMAIVDNRQDQSQLRVDGRDQSRIVIPTLNNKFLITIFKRRDSYEDGAAGIRSEKKD